MLVRSLLRNCAWAGIAFLAAAAVCPAQTPPQPVAHPPHRKLHARAPNPHAVPASAAKPAAPPAPTQPVSLLQLPPQPATIDLAGGKLSVKADNSSLIQIVDQLGKSTGMSVSGLDQDQRVFGVYGPGNPSQVLSELLEGAGYNVLMLGVTREGTPRQLMLSVRGDAPPASPQSFPQQQDEVQPFYQRQPPTPGNLNFPTRSPAQMYQQMMQQRQEQQQQHPQ